MDTRTLPWDTGTTAISAILPPCLLLELSRTVYRPYKDRVTLPRLRTFLLSFDLNFWYGSTVPCFLLRAVLLRGLFCMYVDPNIS
jgi:hypothetical protein